MFLKQDHELFLDLAGYRGYRQQAYATLPDTKTNPLARNDGASEVFIAR